MVLRKERGTRWWLAALIVVGGALLVAACGRKPTAPQASVAPSQQVSVPSVQPTPGQGQRSDGKHNPPGVAMPFFVVGSEGIYGPSILAKDVVVFTITNNDMVPHRFRFVRLDSQLDAAALAKRVRRAGGPEIPGAKVLAEGAMQDPSGTATIHSRPLKPGTFALIDIAQDRRTGKPFGYQDLYVWPITVTPPVA